MRAPRGSVSGARRNRLARAVDKAAAAIEELVGGRTH
jgi:hypothetical protein